MSEREIVLPDLGEGLTEASIVRWLVDVGDTIGEDEVIAEVETAKATVELPSPFAGTVTTRHAEEGDEVAVGAPVLSLRVGAAIDGDAGDGTGAAGIRDGRAAGGDEEQEHAAATDAVPADDVPADDVTPAGAGAPDAGMDDDAGADVAGSGEGADDGSRLLVGYGAAGGRRRRRRVAPPDPGHTVRRDAGGGRDNGARRDAARAGAGPLRTRTGSSDVPMTSDGRPRAKPPVRKMAKDLGVDLTTITGTGPEQRITRDDVRAAADAYAPADARAPADAQAPADAATPVDETGITRLPVTGIRARIAEHMAVAWSEVPAASCRVTCDATALMALRRDLSEAYPDARITPLALVLRCAVVAFDDHPELNATFDADAGAIVRHDAVHLGVATQTDRGLVVPVVRDARPRSVRDLAEAVDRTAAAAREGTLAPAAMVGGTFTVSNYGGFGVDGGTPIVNHPQAAILGVGRIAQRPWVVEGALAVRDVVELSLTFDHRVCDGAEAAGYLRRVADLVQRPALLLAY